MLNYFDDGEGTAFVIEFRSSGAMDFDESGPKVFKIMPDSSLKRVDASLAEVWLERRRAISKAEALSLASMSANFPNSPAL